MKHLHYSAYIGNKSKKVDSSTLFYGQMKIMGKTIKGFITSESTHNFDIIEGMKIYSNDKVELTFVWFSKEATVSDYLLKVSRRINSGEETYEGSCWKLPIKANPDSSPEVTIRTIFNNVTLKDPCEVKLIIASKE